jgi:hypothetical protein
MNRWFLELGPKHQGALVRLARALAAEDWSQFPASKGRTTRNFGLPYEPQHRVVRIIDTKLLSGWPARERGRP